MKKILNTVLAIASITLYSCSKEYELQQSIFIEDPNSPGLPMYTEWGYNTFGAYYDRLVMTNGDAVPMKVVSRDTGTTISFYGYINEDLETKDVQFDFMFPDWHPNEYTKLIILNDTTFSLLDPNCSVSMIINDEIQNTEILNGELNFKRAQNLFVDNYPEEVILSGFFHFQITIDSIPVSIDDGRFDMGVGTRNFFVY